MSEKNNLPAMMEGEANPDRAKRLKWSEFAETTVLDFFGEFKLEKMSVEDGNGNKAKLSRTKDNGIKVEYSSTTIL
ncbi:MAG: hypothetical protein LBR72_09160 [Oscillospiraceae bacterium]|jgi:hypothetical protein|nr:hypothetical protein [Oscillospiraceae bacterium]